MATITNRDDFKDYCMRRLGWPVQQINIDDDQVDDRIDDAVEYFQQYHFDGTQEAYLKYTITDADVENGYITLPDSVVGVDKVVTSGFGVSLASWMTPIYGITFDAAFAMSDISVIPYFITMNRLAELSFLFDQTPGINYNKFKQQLSLNTPLGPNGIPVGTQIALSTQTVTDPELYATVWNDLWLKDYATALLKKQWATNAKLFSNVQLLAGVTLNAQALWDEAIAEIEKLELQMRTTYMVPVLDEIG